MKHLTILTLIAVFLGLSQHGSCESIESVLKIRSVKLVIGSVETFGSASTVDFEYDDTGATFIPVSLVVTDARFNQLTVSGKLFVSNSDFFTQGGEFSELLFYKSWDKKKLSDFDGTYYGVSVVTPGSGSTRTISHGQHGDIMLSSHASSSGWSSSFGHVKAELKLSIPSELNDLVLQH